MKEKYDELLVQGLIKLKDLEFKYVPDNEDINYDFSEKYIRNKERLIKNIGRSYWIFVNTVAKRVAIIIITLIIAFSSLMTVDAFREGVINFIYRIYDKFTEIIEDDTTQRIDFDKWYKPEHIHTSYDIETVQCMPGLFFIIWNNESNQTISFTQRNASVANQFNSEYGVSQEFTVNNTPCLICKTNTDYICYWEFDGYRFELVYPIDLGEEFMSEVVGSLVETDPDE